MDLAVESERAEPLLAVKSLTPGLTTEPVLGLDAWNSRTGEEKDVKLLAGDAGCGLVPTLMEDPCTGPGMGPVPACHTPSDCLCRPNPLSFNPHVVVDTPGVKLFLSAAKP